MTWLWRGLLLAACAALSLDALAAEPAPHERVRLSSPITHSDWMVRKPAPAWGPEGVRQILDRCRSCGWRRVYWRCFDGGRASYPSRLMDPLHGFDEDNYHRGRDSEWVLGVLKQYDFGSFDALKEAISYGHRIGLEVHVWLTINEDDHGWGLTSRFSRENPGFRWLRRDGTAFRSQQSFAYAKVREYKLALLREVLAYKPDGVLFDWIRTGDVRDNPQTDKQGVAIYGYETPNVERFKAKYDIDARQLPNDHERWVRVRAEPQTEFMRAAAKLIRREIAPGRTTIAVLVQQPWGYRGGPDDTTYKDNLHGLLVDVDTWASEHLIDQAFAAGYYRGGGDAGKAFDWLKTQLRGRAAPGMFGWILSPEQFKADTRLAEQVGASELLLWESDYIELPPARGDLVKMMFDYTHPRPASATAPGG